MAHVDDAHATTPEAARLQALRDLQVLDTGPEQAFDDLAWLASNACDAPIALVTLVDEQRQWFKARVGLDLCETGRDIAFCSHAIEHDAVFEVADATRDARFATNPLVTSDPHIRFYAGVPLVGRRGHRYGTLCVLDTRPRRLTGTQREALVRLARRTSASLEARQLRMQAGQRDSTLAHVLDAMSDAVITCDAEGALQECNRAARDWHGVDPRSLPKDRWAGHFTLHDADVDADAVLDADATPLQRARQGESVREAGIVIRAGHAPPRTVSCNADPLRDADGRVLGAVCVMHDVTQLKATQAAVALEAQRFTDAFSAAAQGMALVSMDGRWIEVNDALCEMLGYARPDLLALDFQSLTHPDDLAADMQLVDDLIAGRVTRRQLEKRYLHRSGRIVHSHISVSMVRDAEGQPLHFVAQIQDFTRRYESEQDLRDSEARFRGALESSHDAFVATDEAGRIVEWNRAAETVFGWTRSEVLGQPMVERIVPPDFRDTHTRGMARYLATGEARVLGQRLQLPGWHRTRHEFPIELTLSMVVVGGQRIFSAFMRDISERVAAQDALRKSEAELRTIADNVPAWITHVGPDLRYRFVNRAYAEWFERSAEDLIGLHMRDVLPPEHFAGVEAHAMRALAGHAVSFEVDRRDANGDLRHMLANYVPDPSGPGDAGFHVMIQDITPQIRLARMLERQAFRDDLTGLPNRAAWNEEFARAAARAQRSRSPLAMLFIDLDGFKAVNDAHGHAAGDRVLSRFADLLRGEIRGTDYVARLSGDEFLVLLDGIADAATDPVLVARKIIDAAADETVIYDGHALRMSPSIGIGIQSGPAFDAEALKRCADEAMYVAKRRGPGQVELQYCDTPASVPRTD